MQEGGYLPYFRVHDLRLIDTRESESATLYTLRIRYSDISVTRTLPDNMVLKVSHAGHPQADEEVTFYGRLLPALRHAYGDADLSLCDSYDSCYDIDSDQSHVLMAGLPSSFKQHHEPIPPTKRHFAQLADALALIHACFWQDERLGNTIGLALDESLLDESLARQRESYDQFLSDRLIVLDPQQRAAFDAVSGRIPAQYRQRLLAGQHQTVIHNDLKPVNLLYSYAACRILDWKHWRPGLAVEDLANMIAFHWIPAKRRFEEPRFLKRYWTEMRRCGVREYDFEDFERDYRIAVGLRLDNLIGSWRREEWREGKWKLWETILTGLRAFEDLKVIDLFAG